MEEVKVPYTETCSKCGMKHSGMLGHPLNPLSFPCPNCGHDEMYNEIVTKTKKDSECLN